jgi:hypothetical protein
MVVGQHNMKQALTHYGDFTMAQSTPTTQSAPTTSAASWDLRHPGLVMKDGDREVHEFTGMWPLKPDADLVFGLNTLALPEF